MTQDKGLRGRALLRDPFIHFLILGGILFAAHSVWQYAQDRAARTIYVDPEEMERRAILFAGENKRNPSEDELKALLYDYVQEEALVREARKLGLEEGDTIIRRRLAQKARFMLEDTVDVAAPDAEQLCAWFNQNPQRFTPPARRSFSHIFISPEGRSDTRLRSLGQQLLSASTRGDWRKLGDPFLLNREYRLASVPDVAKAFGPVFAQALFSLDPQSKGFQGPVESAFGLHLVRIDAVEDATSKTCEDLLPQVEEGWKQDQREAANLQAIRDLVDQYDVVVAE